MGDWIVYDVTWDETVEKLLIQVVGTTVISLKIVKEKLEIPPIFLILVIDLSYERPPTTAFFLCTPLHHRSQMGTEQARVTG